MAECRFFTIQGFKAKSRHNILTRSVPLACPIPSCEIAIENPYEVGVFGRGSKGEGVYYSLLPFKCYKQHQQKSGARLNRLCWEVPKEGPLLVEQQSIVWEVMRLQTRQQLLLQEPLQKACAARQAAKQQREQTVGVSRPKKRQARLDPAKLLSLKL